MGLTLVQVAQTLGHGGVTVEKARQLQSLCESAPPEGDELLELLSWVSGLSSFEQAALRPLRDALQGTPEPPGSFSSNLPKPPDTTPPPRLEGLVHWGTFDYVKATPVWFELTHVEPDAGGAIEFLNRSRNPAADWEADAQRLPSNLSLGTGAEGKYSLKLTEEEARGLDLLPGDALVVRQLDAAGNASEDSVLLMNSTKGPRAPSSLGALDDRDPDTAQQTWDIGNRPGHSVAKFRPASDARELITANVRLEFCREGDALVIRGKPFSLEPGLEVCASHWAHGPTPGVVRSVRTTVETDGSFEVSLCAPPEHPVVLTLKEQSEGGRESRFGMVTGKDFRFAFWDHSFMKPRIDPSRVVSMPEGLGLEGAQGATTPGAEIVVTHLRTGQMRRGYSQADGSFRLPIPGLSIGDYVHARVSPFMTSGTYDLGDGQVTLQV